MQTTYQEYLRSQKWTEKKAEKNSKLRDKSKPIRCAMCGSKNNLHYHHLVYRENLDDNTPDTLRILCKRCHHLSHELIKKGKIQTKGLSTKKIFSNTSNAVRKKLDELGETTEFGELDKYRIMTIDRNRAIELFAMFKELHSVRNLKKEVVFARGVSQFEWLITQHYFKSSKMAVAKEKIEKALFGN